MKDTKIIALPNETQPRNLQELKKPAVSIQVLIFSIQHNELTVALINRPREPFLNFWSIPGDMIEEHDPLETAARSILFRKTGIRDVYLEQLYTFGDIDRDPRGRVITIAYFALIPHTSIDLTKAPLTLKAKWVNVNALPELAFDHAKIIQYAVERIKAKLLYSDIAKALLPEKFRLSELQQVYEVILGNSLDKRNFRKKMLSLHIIEPTLETYKEGSHRPAKLFRFCTKELVIFD